MIRSSLRPGEWARVALAGVGAGVLAMLLGWTAAKLHTPAVVIPVPPKASALHKADREAFQPPEPPPISLRWPPVRQNVIWETRFDPPQGVPTVVLEDLATKWPPLDEDGPVTKPVRGGPRRDVCAVHHLRKVWVGRRSWRCQR